MSELILSHEHGRMEIRLRPDGEPERTQAVAFACDLTDEERFLIQWYLEEYLSHPYGIYRERAARAERAMENVGARLFNAVFGDRRTSRLYDAVAGRLGSCRITVEADDAVGWALPWELMRDPERNIWLAQKAGTFARSHPQAVNVTHPVPAALPTLNILMVISRPGGRKDIPFQSVARPLLKVLDPHRDRIRLDILRPPTFARLQEVLKAKPGFYHVLHFDGHGTFDNSPADPSNFYAAGGEQGRLSFEAEDGSGERQVTGEEMAELLTGTGVPVVLLNACQSGMTRPDAAYASVGQQLLAAGARGVVAMAYSVYVPTAAKFMVKFYEALANGRPLAGAVTAARAQLWADPIRPTARGPVELRDWTVPVLFEAAPVQLCEPPAEGGIAFDMDRITGEGARAGSEINMPGEPEYGFIGRDALILELEGAFRSETIVLLEAMAGAGKTTAAVGFARWWAATGALAGPAFFFRFTSYLPLSQVCDQVGQVFNPALRKEGIEWHLLSPDRRREAARQLLRQVPCLLIWDNFEPVNGFPAGAASDWQPHEREELKGFLHDLRGGATKVLITSRRDEGWLDGVYRPVPMFGLNDREAREFARKVLERAGEQLPDLVFGKEADDPYQALLRFLRGNPLALQVILPQVAAGRDPAGLLRDLRSGAAALPDDTAQGRERSLAAALGYGLDRLDRDLRKRLSLLAFFQGFVNPGVLAAMCREEGMPADLRGRDPKAWRADLDKAAGIGLLSEVGTGYYTIHPAVPWFFHAALSQAYGGHRDALEAAYADAYGELGDYLFEQFQTHAQVAMMALRLEEANLQHALRIARRRGQWDAVQGILYGLEQFMDTLGRATERERLVGEIHAEVCDSAGEPLPGREDLWLAIQGHRALLAHLRRDFDQAVSIYLRLKDHDERQAGPDWDKKTKEQLNPEEISALRNVAVDLHQLGMIAQQRRRFDEAERWYRRGLEIEERIGDEQGQATTLHQLGMIAEERRQFKEAERWYRLSLEIEERIGDEQGQALTLGQLGRLAEHRGEKAEAKALYEKAAEIFTRVNDPHSLAIVRRSLKRLEEA